MEKLLKKKKSHKQKESFFYFVVYLYRQQHGLGTTLLDYETKLVVHFNTINNLPHFIPILFFVYYNALNV